MILAGKVHVLEIVWLLLKKNKVQLFFIPTFGNNTNKNVRGSLEIPIVRLETHRGGLISCTAL